MSYKHLKQICMIRRYEYDKCHVHTYIQFALHSATATRIRSVQRKYSDVHLAIYPLVYTMRRINILLV